MGSVAQLLRALETKYCATASVSSKQDRFVIRCLSRLNIAGHWHSSPSRCLTTCPKCALMLQIGFCAMWALDNVFPCEGRTYAVLRTDVTDVNIMLDAKDATRVRASGSCFAAMRSPDDAQGLKLAPTGLEARNDSFSFESVKATCCATPGSKWYYEITIFTSGVMQVQP
jgi:hypothetical protein